MDLLTSLRYRVKWALAVKHQSLVIVPSIPGQPRVFPKTGSYRTRYWKWCGLMGQGIDRVRRRCSRPAQPRAL